MATSETEHTYEPNHCKGINNNNSTTLAPVSTPSEFEDVQKPDEQGESTTKVGFNVLNTIIGSGIIGLPYAIYNAGLYFGILMLIVVAVLSEFGLYALVRTGKRTGTSHYSSVTQAALGNTAYHFINVSMVIDMIGTVICYLIVIGDLTSAVVNLYSPVQISRSVLLLIVSAFVIFPLLFFRNTGPLAKFSIVSVLCLPYIIVVVALRAPLYSKASQIDYAFFGPRVLPAMGVLAFALSSAHVAFSNFQGLRHKTMSNWMKASSFATASATMISSTFAIIGYLSFGSQSNANILLNFPESDPYINTGKFLFVVTLIFTTPMGFYPVRDTLTEMLKIDPERHTQSKVGETICTTVSFSFCVIMALVCTNLGLVYELVGTLSSSMINFLIPALVFLWAGTDVSFSRVFRAFCTCKNAETLPLVEGTNGPSQVTGSEIAKWALAWIVALFGVWVMVLGTYTIGKGL